MKLFAFFINIALNTSMEYTIKFDNYSATVASLGSQLISLKKDDQELLWCRDEKFWADSALVLFPFIGRNYCDSYYYRNQLYNIGIHGFAHQSEFELIEKEDDYLVLQLKQNENTLKIYPFSFTFKIKFQLNSSGLVIDFDVTNDSDNIMPYCLGYHPGFKLNKPLENYSVRFNNATDPKEIGIVTKCMLDNTFHSLKLQDKELKLTKNLFTHSAKVYTNLGDKAILKENSKELLEISYTGFENIVLWQTLNSEADFICIEGWNGLPGEYEKIEDIEKTVSKTCLQPHNNKVYQVKISF